MPLFLFLFGLIVGSFLNVVILRTQAGESLLGRSRCPSCKRTLGIAELVPLLSFLALRAACRFCKAKISWQYPLVELATGLLFLFAFLRFEDLGGSLIFLWRDLITLSFLVVLFVSDLKYGLLPDQFTLPAIVIVFGMNLWLGMPLWSLLAGGAAIGGFFAMQHFFSNGRWVGAGDIRFGVLMGVLLGFANGITALFLSYLIGAVFALFLLARKKVGLKTEIPFGTFLSFSTALVLLTGSWFVDAYFSFF